MHINAASSASDLWQLLQSSQTSGVSSTTSAGGSSSVTSASSDASSLSTAAKLFGKLHDLSQSNPADFKKMAAQIASQLQQAASAATDPSQASALNQLASNFQTASQSGKFSDLFPQSGATAAPGGHHHHHYQADNDGDNTNAASATATQGSSNDALSTIFANALKQIQTNLSSSTSATAVNL